jgi:L-lactate dehydrogenase
MQSASSKVAIIGIGNVGSSFAFALMISGLSREIVLIDSNRIRAEGESMDLNHGISFGMPVKIFAGGYEDCAGSDVIVITAGARQSLGETRLDLAGRNTEIFKTIIPQIIKYNSSGILLIVSNPMDVLTYATLKISGFPPERIMGSGTVLDSSRFRYLISRHCGIDPRNIHAYIIGEHGDTEVPVWSLADVGGVPFARYCPVCGKGCAERGDLAKIFEEVRNAAYKIIEAKGATFYAIALALVRVVEAILRDENSVLPVSTLVNDYYGINDVCFGIPSIVGRNGVKQFLKMELSPDEQQQLRFSANTLRTIIDKLNL